MTNFEKIKEMTESELAELLGGIAQECNDTCPYGYCEDCDYECEQAYKEWLKEDVADD